MGDLDLAELLARATTLARQHHRDATVHDARRLEGGVSSLTYAATLEVGGHAQDVVLKVAPPGLEPVRNRDVLRQARVLRSLADLADFPVPDVLFEDPGDPPSIPPLFAMELAPGQSYEPALDVADEPPSAAVAAERMRVAARALGRMHAVPPPALGLSDEPATPVVEELDRWRRLFATVDADVAVGHEKLHARLTERVPAPSEPRLLHGDYRSANMLFTGSRLEAVIDWEIWSLGDPRSDLAWLMMHCRPAHEFHEQRPPADREAASELPAPGELREEYVAARDSHDPAPFAAADRDLAWFVAVCHYKTASTIAAIFKRDRKRTDPDPTLAWAASRLDRVLDAGHRVLDGA